MVLKDLKDFSVEEVGMWLSVQGLGTKAETFVTEGVDGQLLLDLTDEEFKNDLGLSGLQTKKLMKNIKFTQELTAKAEDGDDADELSEKIKSLTAENDSLDDKIEELESKIAERDAEIEQLKKQIEELKAPIVVEAEPEPAPVVVEARPAPVPAPEPQRTPQPQSHSHHQTHPQPQRRGAPVIRNAAGGAAQGAVSTHLISSKCSYQICNILMHLSSMYCMNRSKVQ
jgi:uncharacterized protein YdcH (DUF465 family)